MEADADMTQVMQQVRAGNMTGAASKLDESLARHFYWKPVLNERLSWGYTDAVTGLAVPGAGREIYEDKVYVRIQKPGDGLSIIDTEAWISKNRNDVNAHNNRFPADYAAFLAKRSPQVIGTPLEQLCHGPNPILKPSQVAEFAFFKVQTAEQLVAMNDGDGSKFPGFQGIKAKIQEYIAAAQAEAPMQAVRAALRERDDELSFLRNAVKELGDRLQADGKDGSLPEAPKAKKPKAKAVKPEVELAELASAAAKRQLKAKGIRRSA